MKQLCIDLRWIDSSGVGTYIQGIMPWIVDNLRNTAIVGLGDPARLEQFSWASAANVRLIRCRAGRYSLAEQLQLPLVIPQGTNLFFSPYYTLPLLYPGKLAVTVHDMSHKVVAEIVDNRKKRLYAHLMFQQLRRRASLIFTVSEFSKAELVRLTHGPTHNIFPTHLGVSAEWYQAAELAPVRTGSYFVVVGNIKPYKNLGRLVEAYLSVRDRVPQELVIVGQSEGLITGESKAFFDRVRGAGNRIHLTGFVSHQGLLSLVGHAHALIMPSLYEGFGLPPLEAMAAGVPVLAARASSLPEICGDAALYFDPTDVNQMADCLVEIAFNAKAHEELRRYGLERSRSFTWRACGSQTAHLLRLCMDGSSLQLSETRDV